MFDLNPEIRERLAAKFSAMVGDLVAMKEPPEFAVAAVTAIVLFGDACEGLARVGAALCHKLELHRASVEDLIAEMQNVGAPEEADPDAK